MGRLFFIYSLLYWARPDPTRLADGQPLESIDWDAENLRLICTVLASEISLAVSHILSYGLINCAWC